MENVTDAEQLELLLAESFDIAHAAAALTPADLAVYHSNEYTTQPWRRADHLDLINEALVMVSEGDILRLGIFVPPRYGKSQLVSKYFPAWYLGNNPDKKVILATNEAKLGSQWGAAVRDVLNQMGQDIFGIQVSQKSSAKNEWTIAGKEGGMRTAGVAGSIVGRGADIFVLDDVVKNHEQAFSKTIQDRNINWWQADALSRLEPGGAVVYIQTRWHEEDLAGKCLAAADEDDDQEPWVTITFSEIAEDDDSPPIAVRGDITQLSPKVRAWIASRNRQRKYLRLTDQVLWAWRWSKKRVLRRKAQVTEYIWNALHQQKPSSAGGLIFQRDHFMIVDVSPTDAIRCRFWDCAGSKNAGDYTVGALISYEPRANLFYLEDIERGQWGPAEVKHRIRMVADRDGTSTMVRYEEEGGSAGKMFTEELSRILSDFNFEGVRATGSKHLRWDAMTAAVQHQRLVLVRGKWNDKYIKELEQLPASKNDDQADASAGAYNELMKKDQKYTPKITIITG